MLLAAQSGASNFALALGSLLVPGTKAEPLPGDAAPGEMPVAARQIAAEPGKELPEITLDLADEEGAPDQKSESDDDAPAGDDLPFAWFACQVAPVADTVSMAAEPVAARAVTGDTPVIGIRQPEAFTPEAVAGEPLAAPSSATADQPAKPVVTREAALPVIDTEATPVDASLPKTPRLHRQNPAAPRQTLPVERAPAPSALPSETAVPATAVAEPALPAPTALSVLPPVAPKYRAAPDTARVEIPEDRSAAPRAAPSAPAAVTPPTSTIPSLLAAVATPVAVSTPVSVAAAPPATPPAAAPAPDAAVTVPLTAPVTPPVTAPAAQSISMSIAAPVARDETPVALRTARPDTPVVTVQPGRQPGLEPAQPLTVMSLIAQLPAQTISAQPFAFTPLRRILADTDPLVTNIAAPGAAILQQVTATPDAQQGTLDMRRQEWMGKMVEVIEAMQEAAPVKETRIALMPEALGKVDISVRQDGERVHVHFATETPAARQILSDAQPRLAELAEARGIRLGQTSFDSGSSQSGANAQSGQRQNEAQRPQTPSAPASARNRTNQSTQSEDERVA